MTRALDSLVGQQTITNIDSDVKGLDARHVVIGPDLVGLGLQVLVCDWSRAGVPSVEAKAALFRTFDHRIRFSASPVRVGARRCASLS